MDAVKVVRLKIAGPLLEALGYKLQADLPKHICHAMLL
jgi:hypothetical protein